MQIRWLKFVPDIIISIEHMNIWLTLLETQNAKSAVTPSHTMKHWLLDCPALSLTRMKISGRRDLNLAVPATSPKQVIALAGRTLVH